MCRNREALVWGGAILLVAFALSWLDLGDGAVIAIVMGLIGAYLAVRADRDSKEGES